VPFRLKLRLRRLLDRPRIRHARLTAHLRRELLHLRRPILIGDVRKRLHLRGLQRRVPRELLERRQVVDIGLLLVRLRVLLLLELGELLLELCQLVLLRHPFVLSPVLAVRIRPGRLALFGRSVVLGERVRVDGRRTVVRLRVLLLDLGHAVTSSIRRRERRQSFACSTASSRHRCTSFSLALYFVTSPSQAINSCSYCDLSLSLLAPITNSSRRNGRNP